MSCDDCDCSEEIVNIPGPQGDAGADGSDGSDGVSAYTYTTAPFTMPAVGSNVTISVNNSSWCGNFLPIYIENARWFEVQSVPDATSLVVKNLGYSDNVSAGAVVPSGSTVSPAGKKGSDGSNGSSGAPDVTTKGDLQTHNGTSSTRKAVGTTGYLLVADSAEATGLAWKAVVPIGGTDNVVPRFDASGSTNPTPLQSSGLSITDNGYIQSTGGNAKGTDATDLQGTRSAATQVASGQEATLSGGKNNTASGANSTVSGGVSNAASGPASTVGGGDTNTASVSYTTVGGGKDNTASQVNATVAGGNNNSANGVYGAIGGGGGNSIDTSGYATIAGGGANQVRNTSTNGTVAGGLNNDVNGATYGTIGGGQENDVTASMGTVPGGYYGKSRSYGMVAHASGRFAAVADAQHAFVIWRAATTDATQTEMFLDGSSLRLSVPTSNAIVFEIQLVGRRDNGDCAVWKLSGGIKNNAGTTSLIGSITETLIGADAGCSATWGQNSAIEVSADDGNDALVIKVTGTAANNIRWVACGEITEVNY